MAAGTGEASALGLIPTGVALTSTSPRKDVNAVIGNQGQSSSPASIFPFGSDRLHRRIPAPASLSPKPMARAEPPAPSRTTWACGSLTRLSKARLAPIQSVLEPQRSRVAPSVCISMVLTAPIFMATGSILSRKGITDCLWGMVTLTPRISRAFKPIRAACTSSTGKGR